MGLVFNFDNCLHRLSFSKSECITNLYFNIMYNQPLILVLYVDSLILNEQEHQIFWCKRELNSRFVDLSLMHYFIGIEVLQIKEETFL